MKLNGKIVSSAIWGGYGLMFQIWLVLVIESTNSEVNTFKIMQWIDQSIFHASIPYFVLMSSLI